MTSTLENERDPNSGKYDSHLKLNLTKYVDAKVQAQCCFKYLSPNVRFPKPFNLMQTLETLKFFPWINQVFTCGMLT